MIEEEGEKMKNDSPGETRGETRGEGEGGGCTRHTEIDSQVKHFLSSNSRFDGEKKREKKEQEADKIDWRRECQEEHKCIPLTSYPSSLSSGNEGSDEVSSLRSTKRWTRRESKEKMRKNRKYKSDVQ